MKMMKNMIIFLKTSSSLNYVFNLGSLLGMIMVFQVLSGLIMVFYYSNDSEFSFTSVQYLMMEVNNGWIIRLIHFNNASLFFLILFLHFFKSLFYMSWKLKEVWIIGLMMFFLMMGISFLGYTLVWAQMSFWAATVITSLISVIPMYGKDIIIWIWSGFNLNNNSLKFFFILHFLLPFLLMFLVIFHLFYLHYYSSSNKINFSFKNMKSNFYPFYWMKDLMNMMILIFFIIFLLFEPFKLSDSLMFEDINELVSPVHIMPEWYFLWEYAILRAVPSKLLGVVLMILGILFFFIFTFKNNYKPKMNKLNKFFVIILILNLLILTWLGMLEPLYPFNDLSLLFCIIHFLIIGLMFLL